MKNSSKAKKIVIAVVAVIIIVAIVVGILLATGVFDVNLTKKSKMTAGIEKLGESFTTPFENIMEKAEKDGTEVKVAKNFKADSAFEVATELSAKIDNFDVEGLSSSDVDIEDVIELINNSKVGLTAKYDGNESAYLKLNGKIDEVELSGEAVYDGSQLGMRSEEINSKWLTLSEKELSKMLEEEDIDIKDVKEMISTSMESTNKLIEAVDIDEKTQKEISERYGKVFKDFINEKSKDIESEKDKVEVDGKDKSCQKLTLELDDKDLKDLLKAYVKEFKNDKQVREILEKTMNSFIEMSEEVDEYTAEEMKEAIDELYNNIDEVNDAIDELEFEGSIKLVVYATSTKVYRTDIILDIEGAEVAIETTFNKETTEMQISAKAQGISLDIATITITEKDNGVNLKVKPSKTITDQLGTDFSLEMDYISEKSKNELTVKVDAGKYGHGTVSAKTDISKNEEKAYEDTTTLLLDIDIPDYITTKMSLTAKTNIKVGEASIPAIPNKESVDMTDETAVQNYLTDSEENVKKLLEKIEDSDVLQSLVSEMSVPELY